jgi:hypothetical protein
MARVVIKPKPELTVKDIQVLSRLVRDEAERFGYGKDRTSPYHEDNKQYWPRQLRELARVRNKLEELRQRLKKAPELPW